MNDPQPNYAAVFETLPLATAQTQEIDVRATLIVDPKDWRDTLRSSLPQLPIGETGAQFELAQVLGRGGMGVVHLAYQSALGRHVAIKTVPPEKSSRDAENALLQEARVMGLVEHPNVVPVHIIGQDEGGRPIIVMKRIEGTTWNVYLDGQEKPDTDDPLGFHLQIAIALCRAISFAHARRILHRDIKPENLMIGTFGEVYVLDWGLAVSLDANVPFVPFAGESNQVVGTPAYMAPEMTVGRGTELDERTDIFLIGAVLYHVVTGEPPNRGESLFDVLACAYEGRPRKYPLGVQSELRDICERAMAHKRGARFASVDELREALEAFLAHRNSYDLTATAFERLATLQAAIDGEDADAAHRAFGEAQFGFVSALEIWDQNPEASEGLETTVRAMINFEIASANPKRARALVSQLPEPDAAIETRIDELEKRLEEEAAKLEKIRYDYDDTVGIGVRGSVVAAMMVLFLVGLFFYRVMVQVVGVPGFWTVSNDAEAFWSIAFGLTFVPVMLGLLIATRRKFADHKTSRVFAKAIALMYTFGFSVRIIALHGFDTSLAAAIWAEASLYASSLMMLGLAIDRRLFLAGLAFGSAAIALVFVRVHPFEIFSCGATAACALFLGYDAGARLGIWQETESSR